MTENQARNRAQHKGAYEYLVVGAGASSSVVAGELSKTGADVSPTFPRAELAPLEG
jgi:hypothetical protein